MLFSFAIFPFLHMLLLLMFFSGVVENNYGETNYSPGIFLQNALLWKTELRKNTLLSFVFLKLSGRPKNSDSDPIFPTKKAN